MKAIWSSATVRGKWNPKLVNMACREGGGGGGEEKEEGIMLLILTEKGGGRGGGGGGREVVCLLSLSLAMVASAVNSNWQLNLQLTFVVNCTSIDADMKYSMDPSFIRGECSP
jgi:hypothetical protein